MKVFKFGGASVKDAAAVRNVAEIISLFKGDKIGVVVSAMGKTTNAIEVVIDNYFNNKKELQSSIQDVKKYHNGILLDLFENENHTVFNIVSNLFQDLSIFFDRNKSPDYNYVYDQVIGYGELISTTIVSNYLNEIGLKNNWLDVREFVKTDNYYRNAKVDWDATQDVISKKVNKIPVEVNDYPGFVANRILMPMLNESIETLYNGVAGVFEIDTVMKLGMAHPMGPLQLADFIGLDVCLSILNVMYEGFKNPKYAPCPLLVNMVCAGKLGIKSGEGFYDYSESRKAEKIAKQFQ